MDTTAVLLSQPSVIGLADVDLNPMGEEDALIDVHWTGISTGTERLMFEGTMPDFPGMGYPLVPGYEAVGEVIAAGPRSNRCVGETVFVPGSKGFRSVRSLFGAAASHLVVTGARAIPAPASLGDKAVLLALAATAHHALVRAGTEPGLIVGHGTLGRLIARLALALGKTCPTVWETNAARRSGAFDYPVLDSGEDAERQFPCIIDASGAANVLDTLIARLAPRGELVLAGFYDERMSFNFPAAFMREARITIAAEFQADDVEAVLRLLEEERFSLDGLITHREDANDAAQAYGQAFGDPQCLKMVLDWRKLS
ncbi:MAG: chlorophyll synthesis pathway protein BchC [Pseudomonadota bacterium]